MKTLSTIIMCAFFLISGKIYSQEKELIALTPDSLSGKLIPAFSGTSLTGFQWHNDKLKG